MAVMTPVWWMAGAGLGSWLLAAALIGPRTDILAGLIGPLSAATVSWVLAERTFRRDPRRLTGVMTWSFAGKMVFFGAYVAVMLAGFSLSPVPFAMSFTLYFVTLHLAEALFLKRLFAGGVR